MNSRPVCDSANAPTRWLVRALPFFVVVAVYGRTLGFDFINYDDNVNVYANPLLADPSPAALLRLWSAPYEGLFVPLTYSLWALLAKISTLLPHTAQPLNPHIFHAANIVVHGLNAVILAALLRRLLQDEWAAMGGALLFALHPVQVEVVAWVSSMKDLLTAFFSLLALWHFVLYAQRDESMNRAGRYALGVLCFGAALLAKPSAVVVPLLAAVLGFFVLRLSPKQLLIMLTPWIVMTIPVVIVTKIAQPETQAIFIPPLWQRIFVAGDTVSFYVSKLIFPWTLAPDYGRTPQCVVGQEWSYFTGGLPWLVAGAVLWRCRSSWVLSALGLFVVAIMPVSGILPFSYQAMSTVADRYMYLAMLGPAYLTVRFLLSYRNWRLGWCIIAMALILCAARSLVQLPAWRDSLSFNSFALEQNPRSWTAATNLGVVTIDQGDTPKAIALYEKAIALNPGYFTAYYNLGVAWTRLSEVNLAASAYRKAIENGPYFFLSYYNLCTLYLQMGQGSDAVAVFRQAVKVFVDPKTDPDLAKGINDGGQAIAIGDTTVRALLYNLAGQFTMEMNQPDAAINYLHMATTLNPGLAEAFNNLGNAHAALGQGEEASAAYSRAVELAPDAADPYNNLCLLYNSLNRGEEAVTACQQAIARNSDFAEAYFNLGNSYQLLGRNQESVNAYKKSLELDPNQAWAAFNAAWVFESVNNTEEAIVWYRQAIRIQPEFAEAYRNLSRALLSRGDTDGATEMYLKAKGLGMSDALLDGVLRQP